ncbi:MAG: hypothetical protein HXS48_00095 [Theionarchaea archaeon]|nr:hypothetical protein [Theionarchaea archaeon]
MKLNEVSEIEITTFVVSDVSKFNRLNLKDKLKKLESLEGTQNRDFSGTYEAIGLGDAFQKALNAMHGRKAKVARIIERRVIIML